MVTGRCKKSVKILHFLEYLHIRFFNFSSTSYALESYISWMLPRKVFEAFLIKLTCNANLR